MRGASRVQPPMRRIAALAGLLCLVLVLSAAGGTEASASAPRSCVPGPHTGVITATQEWCLQDSPHLMTGDVTVPGGMILTIEAGVTVMGADNVELLVQGQLHAPGTEAQPILFTSEADTGPEQWSGLAFDGGSGHLEHTTVRYGGDRNSVSDDMFGNPYYRADLTIRNGTLQLENVTVRDLATDNNDYGLIASNSHLFLSNSLFTGLGGGLYAESDVPVRLIGPDTVLEMSDCTFAANANDRVLLDPGAMMGHDTTLAAQPALDGYEVREDYIVPPAITLTIEPGVAILSGQGSWGVPHDVIVEGHLEALGTEAEPIVFTSVHDSGPEQWNGLAFNGGSGNLRQVVIRNAGRRNAVSDNIVPGNPYYRGALTALNASLHLEQVTLRDVVSDAYDHGLLAGDSDLTLDGCLFTGIGGGGGNEDWDFAASIFGADSVLDMRDCTFTGNLRDRVHLWPDEPGGTGALMGHDTTLTAQAAFDGYELQDDSAVPLTVTLTIEPGVTVRGGPGAGGAGAELLVRGHLEASGTAEEPILFTSADDSAPNQWAGLIFDGSAGAGTGHLQHATIRYAGREQSILGSYLRGSNVLVHDVTAGEVRIEDSVLQSVLFWDGWHSGSEHGVCVENSHVAIENTLITDVGDNGQYEKDTAIMVLGESVVLVRGSILQANGGAGFIVEGDDAFVRVNGSSIAANQTDGVRNLGQATVILSGDEESGNAIHDNDGYGAHQADANGQILATYNWWGDASGPTHADNPGGLGDEVSDWVLYDPWLMEPPAPPTVTHELVWSVAPTRVSAGETTNLGIYFQNGLTQTLTETLVVLELPWESYYLYSTGGGEYWPEKHRVQWKLGDVEPGETFAAAAQVQFKWGVPNNTLMRADANVAAGNLPSPYVAHPEQYAYEPVTVVAEQELSQEEVDIILAADAELAALFDDALAQEYEYFGNATQQTMSDGTERVTLVLIDRDRAGELAAIRRLDDDERHVRLETPTDISIYSLEGGARLTLATSEWEFWGAFANGGAKTSAPDYVDEDFWVADWAPAACGPLDWGDCVRNCLVDNAPRPLMEDLAMGGAKCLACMNCSGDCLDICSDCARDLWNDFHDERYKDCTRMCADSEQREGAKCGGDKQDCYAAEGMGPYGQAEYRLVYHCNSATCTYDFPPVLEFCPYGCVYGQAGQTGAMDTSCDEIPCPEGGVLRDPDCIKALTAHDPNAMYGPLSAVPGQTVEYTIECENEGEGTAYGVFIQSELPEGLDDTTLHASEGGIYFPGDRMLLWEIGELEPGAGGIVTFSAQVPAGTEIGTILSTQATVHFPSVPETTPTNPVVTVIGEVVAHGQYLETEEGVAVGTTLTGSSPLPDPLTFGIVDYPLNGVLTETLPSLTYGPAVNFEGLDWFDFTAGDAVNTSRPARVSILVHSGVESVPPEVLLTVPRDGADDVAVYGSPAAPGTYLPLIWVMFNEPIDAATLTAASFTVTDAQGQPVVGTVAYDATLRVARFLLGEPLAGGATYTAKLTTAVTDTSGNPLAANHVWTFTTREVQGRIYLPLVLRGY